MHLKYRFDQQNLISTKIIKLFPKAPVCTKKMYLFVSIHNIGTKHYLKYPHLSENIARSQMAPSNTSHWLPRCQVVRLLSDMFFLLEFRFLNLIFTIWVVEFCYNLSCWIWSQFEFLKYVKLWVEFCPNTSFWVLLQFKCLSFVIILVLSFITIWIFEFFTI